MGLCAAAFSRFEIEDMSLNHTSVTLDLDLPALLALQSGLIPVLGQKQPHFITGTAVGTGTQDGKPLPPSRRAPSLRISSSSVCTAASCARSRPAPRPWPRTPDSRPCTAKRWSPLPSRPWPTGRKRHDNQAERADDVRVSCPFFLRQWCLCRERRTAAASAAGVPLCRKLIF